MLKGIECKVISKCIDCGSKNPKYNIKGKKGRKYCESCKNKHIELDLINKKAKCICGENAYYIYPEFKGMRYCYDHKEEGMINEVILLNVNVKMNQKHNTCSFWRELRILIFQNRG